MFTSAEHAEYETKDTEADKGNDDESRDGVVFRLGIFLAVSLSVVDFMDYAEWLFKQMVEDVGEAVLFHWNIIRIWTGEVFGAWLIVGRLLFGGQSGWLFFVHGGIGLE